MDRSLSIAPAESSFVIKEGKSGRTGEVARCRGGYHPSSNSSSSDSHSNLELCHDSRTCKDNDGRRQAGRERENKLNITDRFVPQPQRSSRYSRGGFGFHGKHGGRGGYTGGHDFPTHLHYGPSLTPPSSTPALANFLARMGHEHRMEFFVTAMQMIGGDMKDALRTALPPQDFRAPAVPSFGSGSNTSQGLSECSCRFWWWSRQLPWWLCYLAGTWTWTWT